MQVDSVLSRIKHHPLVTVVIVLGTVVVALSTFTDAAKNLFDMLAPHGREAARSELSKMSLQYAPEIFVKSAEKGDIDAVKLFLVAGMDPNAKDSEGKTGLIRAIVERHAAIVDALLKAKANVNEKDQDGATALMWAVDKGDARIIEALLKAEANVNEEDRYGDTALAWAASRRNKDVVLLFLANGADTTAINRAFVVTASYSEPQVLLRILLGGGADVKKVGSEALIEVVQRDNISKKVSDAVGFLLDLGVDVNGKNERGDSALHLAASEGNTALARTLLDKGADVNSVCDCDGYHSARNWTALQMAAFKGHSEVVDALLAKGADIHQKNSEGATPLHLAMTGDSLPVVQALLAKGADVNARDSDGETPLMNSFFDNADTVRALLDKGADVNAKDNRAWTALIHDAYSGRETRVRALLERHADVNAKSVEGYTALILAAVQGNKRIVRALLERKARVNEKDIKGKTALDYAEDMLDEKKKAEIVRLLKQAGAK